MERAGRGSTFLALACVFVVATILTVSNVTGSKRAPTTAFFEKNTERS